MRRQIAHLPLHTGRAPKYLFDRMHRLAGSVLQLIAADQGPVEVLTRLSDPYWFQAFGCVLGFDWHSSGLTTVTCGAVKEAYRRLGAELGIHVAGGKGRVSRKTPQEIEKVANRRNLAGDLLIHASRMSAKIDSAAVQDGYQIYTHHFFFTDQSQWCVVQQGMNDANGYARRYHWLGSTVESFVNEPHSAVASPPADQPLLLNMVAGEAAALRHHSTELARFEPSRVLREVLGGPSLFMPAHHPVRDSDINPVRLARILRVTHEHQPADFERLLGVPGVGPATLRSLALISELVYGVPACRRDITKRWSPADPPTFSYAHGGKDGHPFPVDRRTYDQSIAVLESAVRRARMDPAGKDQALFRLTRWLGRHGTGRASDGDRLGP